MTKTWLGWINLGLLACCAGIFLLGIFFMLGRHSKIEVLDLPPQKVVLPKGAFSLEKEKYDQIGAPFLKLRFSPMTLRLPDLRNYLVYYGRNERPDAAEDQSLLHFAITGSQEIASVPAGKPLYLVYDKDQPRIKYRFSPGNAQTSLWIEAEPREGEAVVDVAMRNLEGSVIRTPEQFAQFTVREKPFTRFGSDRWELGKWKVDGTILARQRARWYGIDLFFQRHGGQDYKEYQNKQRVDFGEGDEAYSVFMGADDALAWIEDRWQRVEPGPGSRQYPLLVINKVDERLMKLDLWDVEGKGKVTLNLIKSTEPTPPQNLEKSFKFVGARTRTQLMFEVNGERMLLSPQDWLLFYEGKWIKLTSPQQIKAYVERQVAGPLFVVDGISKEEGKQVLAGVLFNGTRTDMKAVEIPLQQGAQPVLSEPQKPSEAPKKEGVIEEEDEERSPGAMGKEVQEIRSYRPYIDKFRERYQGKPSEVRPTDPTAPRPQWGLN